MFVFIFFLVIVQDPNIPEVPPDAEFILKEEKGKISDAIMDAKQVRISSKEVVVMMLLRILWVASHLLSLQRMVEFKRYQEDEKRKKESNIEDR